MSTLSILSINNPTCRVKQLLVYSCWPSPRKLKNWFRDLTGWNNILATSIMQPRTVTIGTMHKTQSNLCTLHVKGKITDALPSFEADNHTK